MPTPRTRRVVERSRPPDLDAVMLPAGWLDGTSLNWLDPLDEEGSLMEIVTGTRPPWDPPPHDPVTAWVIIAIVGGIEGGRGPVFGVDEGREKRLQFARDILSEGQYLMVETLAVPQRYRQKSARGLEEMLRTAPDYHDRLWAACWLILVGWTKSTHCTLRRSNEMPPNMMDEWEELVAEAYAATLGVTSREDILGWRRVDESYEMALLSQRMSLCEEHYGLNGPPPYEVMKDTVALEPGWKQIVHVVPDPQRD